MGLLMAYLHCRVCGWAGNRGSHCPDAESCGRNTLITDEVEDTVPIEIVVVDTEEEVENE